jgi:hypothetical protein
VLGLGPLPGGPGLLDFLGTAASLELQELLAGLLQSSLGRLEVNLQRYPAKLRNKIAFADLLAFLHRVGYNQAFGFGGYEASSQRLDGANQGDGQIDRLGLDWSHHDGGRASVLSESWLVYAQGSQKGGD